MSGRGEIMAAIWAGLRGALLPDAASERPQGPPPEARPGEVGAFVAAVEALGGEAHLVEGPQAAAQKVIEVVRAAGAERVLAWSEEAIGVAGLEAVLRGAGIAWCQPEAGVHPAAYSAFEVGLTGAEAGLADSGALVVASGPGRARAVSLLPPLHVALLPVERLYADMAAYWAAHSDALRSSSNLVFIAGPSRTADIELTLTLGVHGPHALHVVLVGGGQHGTSL